MTTERDIHNQIEYARNEGAERGREEGREEGRKEGREEGREEGRKKLIEVAANLKAKGFPLEAIAEATGLSKEQLEAL